MFLNQRCCMRAAGVLALAAMFACASPAAASYTTLVNSGPSDNRVDMVFIGDGYLVADLNTQYLVDVNAMLRHMFDQGEQPFPRYRNFFNVHKIDVVSNERGADIPPSGIFKDTALDAKYYYDGATERLLYINDAKAQAVVNANLTGGFTAEMKFATVNSSKYGGGGGSWAVYAGSNASSPEIALHEQGHSFSGLADEYGGNAGTYAGGEPGQLNVTKASNGAKWSRWAGYVDPVLGPIGAFEGGLYYDKGVYRPTANSKMRSLGRSFDPIAREKFILDIYKYVDPLDSYTPIIGILENPVLTATPVDADVITVNWLVDGDVWGSGLIFDPLVAGVPLGMHTITAYAFDRAIMPDVDWVRVEDQSPLQQYVTWQVNLVPEPTSLLPMVAGLMFAGRRRRRVMPVAASARRSAPGR